MYLTASSAAWRYSGKVTAPVSSLMRPTLIGVPVAAFGVPSADDVSAWVEVVDAAELDEDDLLLLPHPAASNPAATSAVIAPAQCLVAFMWISSGGGGVRRWPERRPRRGSWTAGGRADHAGRRPCPRARAGRGSARTRGRQPPKRAPRAVPRTARRRPVPPRCGAGPAAAARRSRARARGSSRPRAGRAGR